MKPARNSINSSLTIGEAAHASGVTAKMIRHYEAIGLIPPSARTDGGYRIYDEAAIHVLRFIRRARTLGFSMIEIKKLLGLWHNRTRSSANVQALARTHIAGLEKKIAELRSMRDTLQDLVSHCHGDDRPDCPIIQELTGENASKRRLSRKKA